MRRDWGKLMPEPGFHGIRKKVLVLYTVNCSSFAAREICLHFRRAGKDVDVVGNESCYDNQAIIDRLLRYATHVNVGAVLVVSHGCEFIQGDKIAAFARERGRDARVIYGQHVGTAQVIRDGIAIVEELLAGLEAAQPLDYRADILGLAAQTERLEKPAAALLAEFAGLCVQQGKAVLFRPLVLTKQQAQTLAASCPDDRQALEALSQKSLWLRKNDAPCACMGGNGVLTELLLPLVRGVVKIAQRPKGPGVWLFDGYQDQDLYKGYPNATVLSDLPEFAACGAKLNVLACDRGLCAGVPVAPVLTCSFSGNADADVRLPAEGGAQQLLEAVTAAEQGKVLSCEGRLFAEDMLFRNAQK